MATQTSAKRRLIHHRDAMCGTAARPTAAKTTDASTLALTVLTTLLDGGRFGARVDGVDLAFLKTGELEAIRGAYRDYLLLYIPGQQHITTSVKRGGPKREYEILRFCNGSKVLFEAVAMMYGSTYLASLANPPQALQVAGTGSLRGDVPCICIFLFAASARSPLISFATSQLDRRAVQVE